MRSLEDARLSVINEFQVNKDIHRPKYDKKIFQTS